MLSSKNSFTLPRQGGSFRHLSESGSFSESESVQLQTPLMHAVVYKCATTNLTNWYCCIHYRGVGFSEDVAHVLAITISCLTSGSHYVMLEPTASAAAGHRDLAERLFMAPKFSFAQSSDEQSPRAAMNTVSVGTMGWNRAGL